MLYENVRKKQNKKKNATPLFACWSYKTTLVHDFGLLILLSQEKTPNPSPQKVVAVAITIKQGEEGIVEWKRDGDDDGQETAG